jgi:hypothetical protein
MHPRLFILILLFCSGFQLHAWPWRSRNREAEKPSEESTTVFEAPVETPKETPAEPPAITDPVFAEETLPEIPIGELPKAQRPIMGKGEIGADLLISFLLSENRTIDREFIEELAQLYITEAEAEGINHDVAFAQMCLETGFLRFGGLVSSDMNNFCGLGSIGPGEPGEKFTTVQFGVRAHIQHLKAYATDQPLKGELVDPRYRYVRRGSVPAVQGLAGTWAADKQYAEKIEAILARLYNFTQISSAETNKNTERFTE